MTHIVQTGAQQRTEVVGLFGGRLFNCTPGDTFALFAASAGDPPQGDSGQPWSQADVTPRFDGLYVSAYGEFSSYLRFSDSGRVSQITSTGNPVEVARWLGTDRSDLPQGSYAMDGRNISFSTISPPGQVSYRGQMSRDATEIRLEVYSEINGKRSEQTCTFVPS